MKLCCECKKKPWPYLIVLLVAGFSAFITLLTFKTTSMGPELVIWLSAGVFCAVTAILLVYMLRVMSRHCGEDNHSH